MQEIVDWISGPDDIKERAERLTTAFKKSYGFSLLVNQQFAGPKFTYSNLLAEGELEIRSYNGHESDKHNIRDIMIDLINFRSDQCGAPADKARAVTLQRLDISRKADLPYILRYIKGEDIFTDKINEQLFQYNSSGLYGKIKFYNLLKSLLYFKVKSNSNIVF